MKTRIVQLPNGKFCVQAQAKWSSSWRCVDRFGSNTFSSAYPEDQYSTIEKAQAVKDDYDSFCMNIKVVKEV